MDPVALLNSLANEPEVLSALAPGFENIDLSKFFKAEGSVMVGDEDGVMLFVNIGNGAFNMHVLFSRRLRGRLALTAIRHMVTRVFTLHGAKAIVGTPPNANLAVRRMARSIGCAPVGHSTDSLGRPCTNYLLERDTWVTLATSSVESAVRWGLSSDQMTKLMPQNRPKMLH